MEPMDHLNDEATDRLLATVLGPDLPELPQLPQHPAAEGAAAGFSLLPGGLLAPGSVALPALPASAAPAAAAGEATLDGQCRQLLEEWPRASDGHKRQLFVQLAAMVDACAGDPAARLPSCYCTSWPQQLPQDSSATFLGPFTWPKAAGSRVNKSGATGGSCKECVGAGAASGLPPLFLWTVSGSRPEPGGGKRVVRKCVPLWPC